MRLRAKVDHNHADIVKALRRVGCNVLDLSRVGSGCPDLLVSRARKLYLVEVKSARGRATPDQLWFQAAGWPVETVHSIEEALQAVGCR